MENKDSNRCADLVRQPALTPNESYQIMNKQNSNQHNNVIVYRHPRGVVARKARRGYPIANFNDRSPEYRAMNAHLHASAHPDEQGTQPLFSLAGGGSIPSNGIMPFLRLRRSYDEQARRNFVRDGVLLAVFVALSAWAIIHAVQAMVGS